MNFAVDEFDADFHKAPERSGIHVFPKNYVDVSLVPFCDHAVLFSFKYNEDCKDLKLYAKLKQKFHSDNNFHKEVLKKWVEAGNCLKIKGKPHNLSRGRISNVSPWILNPKFGYTLEKS